MSVARQLPQRDYLALKAALRDLVDAAGGPARAATHARGNASLMSRYGAVHEEMHAPIDIIADLEAQVGDLIVTRALAALHGYVLVADPDIAPAAPNFGRHVGHVAKEAGDVLAALGTALSDDGTLDAQEAQACLPEVREAQAALAQLTHDLERVAETTRMVPRRPPG